MSVLQSKCPGSFLKKKARKVKKVIFLNILIFPKPWEDLASLLKALP